MRTMKIEGHTITAWAEPVGEKFQGIASISPHIANTWHGGPDNASLICDSMHDTESAAELAAMDEAHAALRRYLGHT